MIAFLDASALIYLVEGREPWAHAVKHQLQQLVAAHSGLGVAMSRLSWLECRVRPIRDGDQSTLALFDAFFSRPDLIWIELSETVVEVATDLRARFGLRTPDALQAACCLQLGHQAVLITGDAAFQRVTGLQVALVA